MEAQMAWKIYADCLARQAVNFALTVACFWRLDRDRQKC